jgi:hypothetical protein
MSFDSRQPTLLTSPQAPPVNHDPPVTARDVTGSSEFISSAGGDGAAGARGRGSGMEMEMGIGMRMGMGKRMGMWPRWQQCR